MDIFIDSLCRYVEQFPHIWLLKKLNRKLFLKHIVFHPTRAHPPPRPIVQRKFVNIGVHCTTCNFVFNMIHSYDMVHEILSLDYIV
jgi:hypothetical protein